MCIDHRLPRLFPTAIALTLVLTTALPGQPSAEQRSHGNLLAQMLKGPLAGTDDIVFAVRVSGRDHWYVNFGYYSCDYGDGPKLNYGPYPDGETLRGYGDGGRLCRLNLRTGELNTLLDDPEGGVRDPQVHYDGQKILFSYRKGGTPTYHLYEINIDGTGLRQLTDGPDDDIEPTYLPDGEHHVLLQSLPPVCQLLVHPRGHALSLRRRRRQHPHALQQQRPRQHALGAARRPRALHALGVRRPQPGPFPSPVDRQPRRHGQMVYYGNEHGGVAMLDAKPIPGTDKVVASFSPGHGRPEHMGYVTVVDPSAGPDVLASTRQVSKGNQAFRDPYAITEDCFLVADRRGIHVMDGQGGTELVFELPVDDKHLECHEPRPLRARPENG